MVVHEDESQENEGELFQANILVL